MIFLLLKSQRSSAMWRILCSVLILQRIANVAGTSCGVSKNAPVTSNFRIVHGEKSDPGAWPWLISLSYEGKHQCGGSIINNQWILTAAHCFPDTMPKDNWDISIGDHELETTSDDVNGHHATSHKIHKLFVHPDYTKSSSYYDIALIKLGQSLHFSDRVSPICLPHPMIAFDEFDADCYAAGWGKTMGTTPFSQNELQHVHSEIANFKQCNSMHGSQLVDGNICFGDGRKGTCKGDSGGPLMCKREGKWILAGVVSWGHLRCQGKPSVFTKVNYYHDWINEIIYKN